LKTISLGDKQQSLTHSNNLMSVPSRQIKIYYIPYILIIFAGNHYGTPKPPHEPKGPLLRRSGSVGQVAPDKRKRTRSQTDSGSTKSSPVPFNEEFMSRKKSLERAHSASNLGPLPRVNKNSHHFIQRNIFK
jgi:hypothetical protein